MNGDGNILFLNRFFHPDHSATSQILTELALDLTREGERVAVITSRLRYDDPAAILPAAETLRGIRIHRIWTTRFGRHLLPGRALDYLTCHLSMGIELARRIQPGDRVVIMTDPPLLSLIAVFVVRLRGGVAINWIQDLFPEVARAVGIPGIGGWLRHLRNRSLRLATLNIAIGEGMAQRLEGEGLPRERLRVVHNWADGSRIRPLNPAENPLRKHWDLEDRFVVGYSGNMGRAHEFDTLLEAARLLQRIPEVVFLFIGGGAQRQPVLEAARASNLDNIHFRPYQPRERLAESLGAADLHWISLRPEMEGLIVPSKFYGIAAAGRPILFVGNPRGEIAGLLERFACGFTVEPGDAVGMAEIVTRLAHDGGLRQRMGQAARRMLEDHFDRPLAARAWRALLAESARMTRPGGERTR